MITRAWVLRQLLSLGAVVGGVLVAQLYDGHGWGVGGWLLFLAAWALLVLGPALVRVRRVRPEPDGSSHPS